MAFNTQEQEIINAGISGGKSKDEVKVALGRYRSGFTPGETPQVSQETKAPLSNRFTSAIGLGGAVDVFGSHLARAGFGEQTAEQGKEFIEAPTGLQTAGAVAQTLAIPAGAVLTGGGSLAGQVATGAGLGYIYDVGSDLAEGETGAGVLKPGAETLAGAVVPPVLRGVGAGLRGLGTAGRGLATATVNALPTPSIPSGIRQTAKELAERVPRAAGRAGDALQEASKRAERIEGSTPSVQTAIKSGLDEVVIDAVGQADDATRTAYREMVEIAEAPRTGLRPAVRPESVAGGAVSDQYKILNAQRQDIGTQIGEAVDKLSTKGATADMLPEQRTIRGLLQQNGILTFKEGINFSQSGLTPKQQGLVKQLYELSTQAENMTPRQVYRMDRLMSQLQREARFDGLDTVFLKTPEGDVNIYRAFKNIFSNKLDEIAPEIAPLNKQYAQMRNLQDDIESSIVKRGNFDSNRNVDASEFAQTNLRRIFSDAQSAADYRALADKLDAFSRANGYDGANPQDLAGFATRLRNIYTETVPDTSLRGGIRGAISDVVGSVSDFGKPQQLDQQKALKALLGDVAEETPRAGFKPGATQSTNLLEEAKKVYHGSDTPIKDINFDAVKGDGNPAAGLGFFTTPSKSGAGQFGKAQPFTIKKGAKTMNIEGKIKNTDDSARALWAKVSDEIAGGEGAYSKLSVEKRKEIMNGVFGKWADINEGTPFENTLGRQKAIRKWLVENDYDVIEMPTVFEGGIENSVIILHKDALQ